MLSSQAAQPIGVHYKYKGKGRDHTVTLTTEATGYLKCAQALSDSVTRPDLRQGCGSPRQAGADPSPAWQKEPGNSDGKGNGD